MAGQKPGNGALPMGCLLAVVLLPYYAVAAIVKRPVHGGAEQDVFTGWRHVLSYLTKPGTKSAVKRRARRRERYQGKHAIRKGEGE